MSDVNDTTETGLSAIARRDPQRVAFVDGDTTRTYGELEARTAALGRAFRSRGIAPGDRVAIMMTNSIEFFETWAAAGRVGASVVLVNWHLKRDELAYILA